MMLPEMPSEAAAFGVTGTVEGTREVELDVPVGTEVLEEMEGTAAVVLPLEMSSVGPRLK